MVLFIYIADRTKNIQTPGKLANYNSDFQGFSTHSERERDTEGNT